jgi:single-strand DNA-binding protein
MAQGDINVTIVGNLVRDPELRFTKNGIAVASFTVVSSSRLMDKTTNEWKDSDPVFMNCNVWREHAENVTNTLTKGSRVLVTGKLKQRSYTTKEGQERQVVELEVEDVGPALRYATAKISKITREGGNNNFATNNAPAANAAPAANDDPWATPDPGAAWAGSNDEAPF